MFFEIWEIDPDGNADLVTKKVSLESARKAIQNQFMQTVNTGIWWQIRQGKRLVSEFSPAFYNDDDESTGPADDPQFKEWRAKRDAYTHLPKTE